jgi:hypothetical protein
MRSLRLSDHIDTAFPQPGSNRGFKPSVFIQTMILMQHDGSVHLDDVRHLRDDSALRTVLGLEQVPQADALGNWLRRMGKNSHSIAAWNQVNQAVLRSTLHNRKAITLDIDATEVVANKAEAQWTYKNNRGYMPMVGHIAETGQIVACDFRQGNTSPAKENLDCDQQQIRYAIRAKMSGYLKYLITSVPDSDWQPLLNRKGKAIPDHSTYRTQHLIGDYNEPFTLVVQRKRIKGQAELELGQAQSCDEICDQGFIYRAIATNRAAPSDSEIIHWYNQRGEDSENRIKELKLDFGGNTLPCSDFAANSLYFSICALAYNLFALMRQLLPNGLECHRVKTIRWRLYAIAAKVVQTGRQVFVKVQSQHQALLQQVLTAMRQFEPPPG